MTGKTISADNLIKAHLLWDSNIKSANNEVKRELLDMLLNYFIVPSTNNESEPHEDWADKYCGLWNDIDMTTDEMTDLIYSSRRDSTFDVEQFLTK